MYSRNSGTRTLKGNEEQFELAGNSSYRGKFQWSFDQGKWNIVRVSGFSSCPSWSWQGCTVFTQNFQRTAWYQLFTIHRTLGCTIYWCSVDETRSLMRDYSKTQCLTSCIKMKNVCSAAWLVIREILHAKVHKHQRYSPRGLYQNCCFYITHPKYIQHI